MSPRRFVLAQVHSDVCLVQGIVLPLLFTALLPKVFSFVCPVPLPLCPLM